MLPRCNNRGYVPKAEVAGPYFTLARRSMGRRGLFDHLISAGKQRRRDGQPQRLRGLEVDDQLELDRLLDRKVFRLSALEDHLMGVVNFAHSRN